MRSLKRSKTWLAGLLRSGGRLWAKPRFRRWRIRLRNLSFFGASLFIYFLTFDLMFPLPKEKEYSQLILARDGTLLNAYLTDDEKWRMHTRLEEVPPELVESLVQKEDRWFWTHPGVNPLAIGRAGLSNLISGKRVSGASTITMQVARMMEPKERTFWSKIKEIFRAFQLEWHYSKKEILEMYLSYLPYGGNIEGVKAASYLYFDRPPAGLSLSQSILLTVVPNRPNSLRPDLQSEAAAQARDKWIERFRTRKVFPSDLLDDAKAEALPALRHGIPANAPQFCEFLRDRSGSEIVVSTIDPKIQYTAQQLLQNHVRRFKARGVSNGAVLIVDNHNAEVLAYCGSADFHDKEAQGEVDGVRAPRSPGSTLKPFIYGMALDKGLITPQMKVLDVPTDYIDYSPVNYDKRFLGEVTAANALRSSLNIPAVRILRELGLQELLAHLEDAGFHSIAHGREGLGLSVALGGCGATMEELVRMYAGFANGGMQRPLRYALSAPASPEQVRLCSPEAAWLLADILSGIQRPDLPNDLVDRTKLPKIAWKTGTSFGRRDAWSIGFNPRYTIGVWVGNMDGTSCAELSGAEFAVPLLVDLYNAIDFDPEKDWFERPEGVRDRRVCAGTGLLPGLNCRHLSDDQSIAAVSPTRTCDRFREIMTDSAGTIQFCTACLPASGYVRTQIPTYPAELLLLYDQQKVAYIRPPIHNPDCEGVFHTHGPEITSPARKSEYLVETGQSLMLRAKRDPGVGRHYWYANNDYLGSADAGSKFFFEPPEGRVEIACMDDKGRIERIEVTVGKF